MNQRLSDRDLVTKIKSLPEGDLKKACVYELYTRYDKFVHKHWHLLTKTLGTNGNVMVTKEDFYADSFCTMMKALEAVHLSKIKNDKWKFLGYYGFFLSNQRNDYAKKIVRKHQKETALEIEKDSQTIVISDYAMKGVAQSAEDAFLEQDGQERFWKAVRHCKTSVWSPTETTLFELKTSGKTIKDICATLNMSSWTYSKTLTQLRNQLASTLDSKLS